MQKIAVTRRGYEAMLAELKQLKSVERPAVIQAIATAREHGDLSENAEYSAAREKQSFIEGRIGELEDKISRAEVVDPEKLTGNVVQFGASVVLIDDNDQQKSYQLVGEIEADISKGWLSVASPLGRALIGKKKGDSFVLKTPGGDKEYELNKIEYK